MAGRKRTFVIKTKLGEREIARDSVIYFPHGLIGLDDKRDFVLIQVRDKSPFFLLQCITDAGLGLLVADPYPFLPDYNIKLEQAEKKILQVENIRQIAVLVTVTIPRNRPDDTTLNLSGPIILNTKARVGLQAPQIDAKHPTHFRLADATRTPKATDKEDGQPTPEGDPAVLLIDPAPPITSEPVVAPEPPAGSKPKA